MRSVHFIVKGWQHGYNGSGLCVVEMAGNTTFTESGLPNDITVLVDLIDLSLYTSDQKRILRIVAIVFASLSTLAGTVMLYWYLRFRRRTFRHMYVWPRTELRPRLIMGLIASDMLRSLFQLAYPVVSLSSREVSPDSTYCQLSGFFTAYFFEASDLMIFIISIHTAVYVFSPKFTKALDEGGRWRWMCYVLCLWLSMPGLLAGLAFIDRPTAYVPLVTWCYLPPQPLVWRYALAWGPRYFILLTISVLYVMVYVYVQRVYRSINKNQQEASNEAYRSRQSSFRYSSEPEQSPRRPHLAYLQSRRPSTTPLLFEENERERAPSVSTESNEAPIFLSEALAMSHTNASPLEIETLAPPQPTAASQNLTVTTFLVEPLPPSVQASTPVISDTSDTFSQRRACVERQMRTLFIFPLVYLIMWIPPFVNHIYQVNTYNSNMTQPPPGTFIITLLATIFLPSQGFVNACIYAIRERPWRRRGRAHQRALLSCRSDASNVMGSEKSDVDTTTLQAQIVNARSRHSKTSNAVESAYTRRDIERRERELARMQNGDGSRPRQENWWDAQDEIVHSVMNRV